MLNKLIFWVDRKIVSRYLNRKGVRNWGLPFYFAMAYSFVLLKRADIPYGVYGIVFLIGNWCAISLAQALRVPSQPQEENSENKTLFSQKSFQDPLRQAAALVGFAVLLPIYTAVYIIIWHLFMR